MVSRELKNLQKISWTRSNVFLIGLDIQLPFQIRKFFTKFWEKFFHEENYTKAHLYQMLKEISPSEGS